MKWALTLEYTAVSESDWLGSLVIDKLPHHALPFSIRSNQNKGIQTINLPSSTFLSIYVQLLIVNKLTGAVTSGLIVCFCPV